MEQLRSTQEKGRSMLTTNKLAHQIRKNMLHLSKDKPAHIVASSLSIVDIMAVLYGDLMQVNPKNPNEANRDRFILSKGHAALAVYATLIECGFFSKELLLSDEHEDQKYSLNISHYIPGVELSTGSLGHGLPVCTGMAYSAKLDHKKHHIIGLLGDGECNSGAVWEAALFSGHHMLNNLIAIIDYNKIQRVDKTHNVLNLEPFADKWVAFGWRVLEADGHNHIDLQKQLREAFSEKNKPTVVICHTIKGKGISFLENKATFPFYYLTQEHYINAIKEIEAI